MVNKEALDYIKKGLKRGFSIRELKQSLLARGFSDYDVDEAIKEVGKTKEEVIKPVPALSFFSPKFILYSIFAVLAVLVLVFVFILKSPQATVLLNDDLVNGSSIDLMQNKIQVDIDGKTETLELSLVSNTSINVTFDGSVELLRVGDQKAMDLSGDGIADVIVRLENVSEGVPKLFLKKIDLELQQQQRQAQNLPSKNISAEANFCRINWTCEEWGPCSYPGKQNKTCYDSNNCNKSEVVYHEKTCPFEFELNETIIQEILGGLNEMSQENISNESEFIINNTEPERVNNTYVDMNYPLAINSP